MPTTTTHPDLTEASTALLEQRLRDLDRQVLPYNDVRCCCDPECSWDDWHAIESELAQR